MTLSITSGTGTGAAQLTCTHNPVAASSGLASASPAAASTRPAPATPSHRHLAHLTSATSGTVDVTLGSVSDLAFSTSPAADPVARSSRPSRSSR